MTSIFNNSFLALNGLIDVLQKLQGLGGYNSPCNALSDASIGQHTRHIIELYQCLLDGYDAGEVNYDGRQRNPVYENDASEAMKAIETIKDKLQQPDKTLSLVCAMPGESENMQSNYYREVLYNLEHCIHHQALIKVALVQMGSIPVAAGFGVAPSTIQYRNQCAQ